MIDRHGSGTGCLVVALHGAPANRKAWLGLVPHLPVDVTLLAPDLAGNGSRSADRFALDEAMDDLAAVLARERAAVPARTTIVAGDSFGGYLALAAGARVAGVDAVVAGGCTFEMRGAASALALASDAPVRLALGLAGRVRFERLTEAVLRRVVGARVAREIVAAGVRYEARAESIRALAAVETAGLVGGGRAPIVFVNGSRDWPTRAGEGRFLRLARRAELVLADGAPHGVSLFAPAAFARAIGRARELANAQM